MKNIYYIFCFATLLILTVLVGSCSDDDGKGEGEMVKSRRTVVIYISGQNSLGYQGAVGMDSTEIARGMQYIPSEKDNIVLYIDDAKKPRLHQFYRKSNGKAYQKELKKYLTEVDSSDPATLTEVLNIAQQACPSQSYGLVLWSHGTGWLPELTSLKGIGSKAFGIDVGEGGSMLSDLTKDGNLGSQMEIEELASAIKNSKIHLDFIVFDACMMQGVEVAYTLRNVTDYIVASPTFTSGYGCEYGDQIKNGFFAYPACDDSIKKIADTYYYDVMENPDTKKKYEGQGCVISVVKTKKLETLAQMTSQYIGQAIKNKESVELPLQYAYVDYNVTGYPDCYDMSSTLHKLLPENAYNDWKQALDMVVIYKRASHTFNYGSCGNFNSINSVDKNTYCGMSMFVPQKKYEKSPAFLYYNDEFKKTEWYTAAGWEKTGW